MFGWEVGYRDSYRTINRCDSNITLGNDDVGDVTDRDGATIDREVAPRDADVPLGNNDTATINRNRPVNSDITRVNADVLLGWEVIYRDSPCDRRDGDDFNLTRNCLHGRKVVYRDITDVKG